MEMASTTKFKYAGELNEKGHLIVKSVHLSRHTPMSEKPQLTRDLDDTVYAEFLANFERRVAENKTGAFVLAGHFGPGIGHITKLWVEDDILMGDLVLTNPDAIAAIDREEFTERSIEYGEQVKAYDGTALLKGVALLSGTFGHDSLGFPDFVVQVKEIENVVDTTTSLVYQEALTVKHLTIDSEDSMDLKSENEKLKARVAELEKADPIKLAEQEGEKLVAKRLEEIEAREADRELDHYCSSLSEKLGLSKAVVRAKFERETSTPGERRILFNTLSGSVIQKAALERDWVAPSQEETIRKHYHEQGGEKYFGVSENDYVNTARKVFE